MPFTVIGYRYGTLDIVRLQTESLKRKGELLSRSVPLKQRNMQGYLTDAYGFNVLDQRYGPGFANFVLLDDVAIEACERLGVFLGQRLGTVEDSELGDLLPKLPKPFSWAYWTADSPK
jgi:hypothetical protein